MGILKKHFDNIMILLGVLAFITACLLFTYKPAKDKINYIDLGIDVKGTCRELLKEEREKQLGLLGKLQAPVAAKPPKTNPAADTIRRKIFLLDRELRKIETGWDSSFTISRQSAFGQAISVVQDSLASLVNNHTAPKKIPFYYEITDTSKYVKSYELRGHFSPAKSPAITSHIDLFKKYPSTAFWVILSIAQFVFWVIIIGVCLSLFYTLHQEIKKREIESQTSVLIVNGIVTLIALGLFITALLLLLYDRKFPFDHFFFEGFTWRMICYALVGYFSASLFLYGYSLTGYYVRQSQSKFASSLKSLNETKSQIRGKTENLKLASENLTQNQINIINNAIEQLTKDSEQQTLRMEELKNNYELCNRYFRFFFIISAIVLSVLVIWVGSLFAAVNSIDVFQFYKTGTGRHFLRYDFVYLYGGIHSILLFIFYIPVKLRLVSMSFAIPEANNQALDSAPVRKFFTTFFTRFIEIATASAPLLTALLQSVIEG